MNAVRPVASFRRRRAASRLRGPAAAVLALALLAGCAAKPPSSTAATGGATRVLSDSELEAAVAGWGQRYAAEPNDKMNALNYAAGLRRLGRTAQAVAVLQRAAINFSKDRDVLAAYGKALAADGQLERALEIVRRAQTPDQPDWRLMSAEAAILDQLGQNAAARRIYMQALDLVPNEPSVLSNLGMSYVMTSELPAAEKYLRQAAAQPGADSRVRQNLALVVGLQGRFAEAEEIARKDLSPTEAEANVAYLKAMLSQPDTWKKLKTAGDRPGAAGS